MTLQRPPFRRRHYFINKDFQLRFILKFCLLILCGVLISTGLLFLFSQDTLTSTYEQSRLVIKNTSLAILPATVYTNLITLGLICFAAIAVTLFVSHKLSGPMFRFEEDLRVIGDGDLTKVIRIRKKDQFRPIADSLNRMTGNLREKIRTVHADIEDLRGTASRQGVSLEMIEGLAKLQKKIEADFKL